MTDAGMLTGQGCDHASTTPPTDQPVSVHAATMCVSTPAGQAGGGPGAAHVNDVVCVVPPVRPKEPAVSLATIWYPPPPDLVSVLSVSRR